LALVVSNGMRSFLPGKARRKLLQSPLPLQGHWAGPRLAAAGPAPHAQARLGGPRRSQGPEAASFRYLQA